MTAPRILLACLALLPITAPGQNLVTRYWPLNVSDRVNFTSTQATNDGYTLLQAAADQNSTNFNWYFCETNYYYGPFKFGYSADHTQLLQTTIGRNIFSPALVLLNNAWIAKGGSSSKQIKIIESSTHSLSVTARTAVTLAGTVTVPAGTFKNCLSITVTASLQGQTITLESFVIAPKVGIIRLAIEKDRSGKFVWEEASGGTVGRQNLTALSDTTAPTASFTSTTNQEVMSGGSITFLGSAADTQSGVSNVLYQLGGGTSNSWQSVEGTTNWSLTITPTPGPNTLFVKAIDNQGNESSTVARNFFYAVPCNLSLSINHLELGKVTGLPQGPANIGTTNTLKAVSDKGIVFLNWTLDGKVLSTNPNLKFVMPNEQNPNLQANFADVTRPAIAISAPASRSVQATNSTLTLMGTATDNVAVQTVSYSLGGTANSEFSSGATLSNRIWSATVTLAPGINNFYVRAADSSGNLSTIASRSIFYTAYKTVTLGVNDPKLGSIIGLANNSLHAVGKPVKVTAIPAKNQLFQYWSDGLGNILSCNNSFSFVMPDSDSAFLQANFATNQFLSLQGSYAGLFSTSAVNLTNSGSIKLIIRDNGKYSGSLSLFNGSYSFSGQFRYDGTGSNHIIRKNGLPPLDVLMEIGMDTNKFLIGEVTQGLADPATIDAGFSQAIPNSPFAGQYTLHLRPQAPMGPGGASFGTLTVNSKGLATLGLTLADEKNLTISASGYVQADGTLPLFSSLYGARGMIMGWLTLNTNTATANSKDLVWVKLPGKSKYHPQGFNLNVPLEVSRWVLPKNGFSGLITLTGGDLGTDTITANYTFESTQP